MMQNLPKQLGRFLVIINFDKRVDLLEIPRSEIDKSNFHNNTITIEETFYSG
jgi:hypothetical protein